MIKKETGVSAQEYILSLIHIYSVHIGIVESLLLLAVHVVEHVFALRSQVPLGIYLEGDGGQRVGCSVHLLHLVAAQQEEGFAVLVQLHVRPSGIHLVQQTGLFLAQIHLPEVVAAFEGCQVVECLAILGDEMCIRDSLGIKNEQVHFVLHSVCTIFASKAKVDKTQLTVN